ncbi:MAG TPA: phosphatase PAP2 family protein [Candidatus Binatia bacterium]|nr:phosphatase PAP2 family protein [Candidatus Binatia bacterium]
MRRSLALLALLAGLHVPAAQGCGNDGLDQRWRRSEAGLWDPDVYRSLFTLVTAANIGGALWQGREDRFGHALWQSLDAQLITLGSTEVLKHAFARERPRHTADPCRWFSNRSSASFPSGESASALAMVLPLLLEYRQDHPVLAYSALLLPAWIGVARVKGQAHWQTDVLAGWTVGGLAGWYAHERDTPLLVEILPDGFTVGLETRF